MTKRNIIFLAVVAVGACNKNSMPSLERTYIAKEKDPSISAQAILNPLSNSDFSACQLLNVMKIKPKAGVQTFSLAHYFSYREGESPLLYGAVEAADSPLIQMILATKNMTAEDFYNAAVASHDAGGEPQGLKWEALRLAWASYRNLNIRAPFELLQSIGINSGVEEAFPGVFGQLASMDKSLLKLLLMKVSPGEEIKTASNIVTVTTPLFISPDWKNFGSDAQVSLSAAIRGSQEVAQTPEARKERMCSLVLLQRNFAQLLKLKGYAGVDVVATTSDVMRSQIEKQPITSPKFNLREVPGAFVDSSKNANVVLEEDDILNYSPTADHMLSISKDLPKDSVKSSGVGTLHDTLELLEALVYAFQATSPSAPWIKKESDYLLGDISSTKNLAIVPAESHQLACGLISVILKNLSKFNIVQVTSDGRPVQSGQAPAGIMIAETKYGTLVHVDLKDVMRLTRIMVYLDNALSWIAMKDQATLERMNNMYSKKKIAMLLGTRMLSKADVEALLTPEERESILADKLEELRVPVAMLLSNLRDGKTENCFSSIKWNVTTGKTEPEGSCTPKLKQDYKDTVELLSRYTKSIILLGPAAGSGS